MKVLPFKKTEETSEAVEKSLNLISVLQQKLDTLQKAAEASTDPEVLGSHLGSLKLMAIQIDNLTRLTEVGEKRSKTA